MSENGNRSRLLLLRCSVLAALCVVGCSPSEAPPADSTAAHPDASGRPVLFYLIDTLRADRMGVYGYDRPNTPFLSELARHAVVFENCFSQASWTKPSVGSMLTSRYPSEVGMRRKYAILSDDFVTLPEVLQAGGWSTAGFSANPLVGKVSNYAQGFDTFLEASQLNRKKPARWTSGSAARLHQYVERWLDRDPPGPQFLYVHAVDPHAQYEPERPFLERFADPARDAQFREEWDTLNDSDRPLAGYYMTQPDFDRAGIDSRSFIEHGSNLYDADILACDTEIGRLWELLESEGWGENCIAVFTSDHGEEFFEHGGTSHSYSLYNELLHIPLILYAPGLIPGGRRIEEPVSLMDVYPTLLELLDLEIPAGLRGRSLVPLIQDETTWEREEVLAESSDPLGRESGVSGGTARVLISWPWKLIHNIRNTTGFERPPAELYDLSKDPGETRNLAEEHPGITSALQAKLDQRWESILLAGVRPEEIDLENLDPTTIEALRELGYIQDG